MLQAGQHALDQQKLAMVPDLGPEPSIPTAAAEAIHTAEDRTAWPTTDDLTPLHLNEHRTGVPGRYPLCGEAGYAARGDP